jgi:uncharacterized membrane protein
VLIGIGLAGRRSDLLTRGFARVPTLRIGLICYAVLVTLATVLNDSGVQVTAMMAATLLPVLIVIATRVDDDTPEPDPSPNPDSEPTPVRARAGERSPA